jgi:hypothetical protein
MAILLGRSERGKQTIFQFTPKIVNIMVLKKEGGGEHVKQ